MTATEDYRSIAFLDFFADIEDPRIERHKLYQSDILNYSCNDSLDDLVFLLSLSLVNPFSLKKD